MHGVGDTDLLATHFEVAVNNTHNAGGKLQKVEKQEQFLFEACLLAKRALWLPGACFPDGLVLVCSEFEFKPYGEVFILHASLECNAIGANCVSQGVQCLGINDKKVQDAAARLYFL